MRITYGIMSVMVDGNVYAPKKVLITQNALQRLQGSEITCLEVAQYFKSKGAEVQIYTWHIGEPVIGLFKDAGLNITTDEDDEFFEECDFVWVHHQVLPRRLLRRLTRQDLKRPYPFFVFFHMSSLENLFLEQPYINDLEQKIASKILFVSQEAHDALKKMYCLDDIACPEEIFPNPAPESFTGLASSSPTPKKFLIVSNHVPQELLDTQALLLEKCIKVEFIGEHGESYTRITPELLTKYDAVITIGKTVQYCLVGGKPVYIYDKFGGPGYLNEQNLELAAYHNFSGRGFSKKTATEITSDLIGGYSTALSFAKKQQKTFQKLYLLPEAMTSVLRGLVLQHPSISRPYYRYVDVAERVMQEKIRLEWKCIDLQRMYNAEQKKNQEMQATLETLDNLNNELKLRLDNALCFRGSHYINKFINKSKRILNKIKSCSFDAFIDYKRKMRIRIAKKYNWQEYYFSDNQSFFIRDSFVMPSPNCVTVLTRVRNEELILPDTLKYLSGTSSHIFAYDDDSSDKTFELLCKDPNVTLIVTNLHWRSARTEEETRSRGVLLEEAKKHSNSEWFWYTDADERIMDNNICKYLEVLPDSIDGVAIRLFDAYMTLDDNKAYESESSLKNFRRKFGPEYRDILTFFRNRSYISYQGLDAREPIGVKNIVNHFYCQHYGKALSYEQWQETCKYYMKYFDEPYKTKWKNRLGKSIHEKSDWGGDLYNWGDELFQHEEKLLH